MERQQLLKNDSLFAGYIIVGKLSHYHNGEREVYHALSPETGEKVALTVFNLGCKRYETELSSRKRIPDFIEEVRFLTSCSNKSNVFARVLDCGISGKKPKRLAWMAQAWEGCNSLTSELIRQSILSKEDMLKIMKALISGVAEIRSFTRGGGHYGISAENILLEYDGDKLKAVRLIGLSNIGTTYNGAIPFDRTEMDKRFLPCESANGVFNHLTDVYALGMLMGWMLGGLPKFPQTFDNKDCNSSDNSSVELFNRYGREIESSTFRNWFTTEVVQKQFSGALRMIWTKATNPIPGNRFLVVEKFQQLLDKVGSGELTSRYTTEARSYGSFTPRRRGLGPLLIPPEEEEIEDDSKPKKLKMSETERVREAMVVRGLDAVAGMDNLKQVFRRNFVHIVKNPNIAKAYGITPGNCTLLYGPQGCGKTFIAQKVAEESGLNYQIVNPSDLGSIYIHGAQEKIAETFRNAEKKAPMILIFDEFDAVAPKRDGDLNTNQANEVNELLVQLNNCASKGIYVLATTNRPELIDSAILRTGRVDQMFYVPLPDFKARHDIFALELENRPVSDDINLDVLAKATENFTCSDLSFIVKECARNCFDKTISLGLSEPLPLSQSCILEVISNTRSSVSAAERKKYEDLKDQMEQNSTAGERKKVGFVPGY